MRKKADVHISIERDTLNKLNEMKDKLMIERSTMIEIILIKGMEQIKELNYNFTEFMNKKGE